jgi:hypothetical protein
LSINFSCLARSSASMFAAFDAATQPRQQFSATYGLLGARGAEYFV